MALPLQTPRLQLLTQQKKPGKKRKHRTPDTGDASVVAMVAFCNS